MGTRCLAVVKWIKGTVSDPVGHRKAERPEQSWWQVPASELPGGLPGPGPRAPACPLQGQSQADAPRVGVWPAAHLPCLPVPLAQRGWWLSGPDPRA